MQRFAGPGWRLLGSVGGWILFSFSFLTLYQVAAVVTGLGGFCASGGAYVIATECPASVQILAAPSVFGMLIAVGLAVAFGRGFGTPLVVWAWPILFIGLGIQFATIAIQGDIVGIILAVMFIAMGVAPLVWEIRAGTIRLFIGSHNLRDQPFALRENAPRTIYSFGRDDPNETVGVTGADVGLSLGMLLFSIATGAGLSFTAFTALAAAG